MSKEFLGIQATIKCGFTPKCVCDMTRTYSQSNTAYSLSHLQSVYHGKINKGVEKLHLLREISKIERKVDYSCFLKGYKHKFDYCMRTILSIGKLRKVEKVVLTKFIPTVMGEIKLQKMRESFSAPTRRISYTDV